MPELIRIRELKKTYSGVHALSGVSFDIQAGEVHALCGENGAGKSTLIKCLTGVAIPDSGSVSLSDRSLAFGSVTTSERLGIAVIHQEATVFPDLNAVDNVFVGRELTNRLGMLDHGRMRATVQRILESLGQGFDLRCPIAELSLANRQMVMMARALSQECKLLIMDEPTASLSSHETEVLLQVVRRLRSQGVSVLYVSHRLGEVFAVADRVSVLRDGCFVGTEDTDSIDESQLVRMMVGRELSALRPVQSPPVGDVRMEVRGLTSQKFFDINMHLCAGEVVGIAGLVGAGRSELVRALMGIDHYQSGAVVVNGRSLTPDSVQTAMDAGLALVPEDRQHEGLALPMSVADNMIMAVLPRLAKFGLTDKKAVRANVARLMQRLNVKAAGPDMPVSSLSGGNQQKVVLAKWLAIEPQVLMLDEPTRGVDIAAKSQVHALIRELAGQGLATLVVSSELPELLAICDRILVMREGTIAGEVVASEATQESVLQLALPDQVPS